jgi:hypothetical protein
MFVAETAAAGMTFPDESVTVPDSVADDAAKPGTAQLRTTRLMQSTDESPDKRITPSSLKSLYIAMPSAE